MITRQSDPKVRIITTKTIVDMQWVTFLPFLSLNAYNKYNMHSYIEKMKSRQIFKDSSKSPNIKDLIRKIKNIQEITSSLNFFVVRCV